MIGRRSANLVSSALRSTGPFTHAECSLHVAKRSLSLSAVCSKQPSKVNKQQQQATGASSSADPAAASGSKDASSCVAGTVLTGLNIYKDRADPVALPDAEYPPWLWTLLDDGNVTSDGVQLESTDGLTKGQARIVEKRNLRLIRAAFRAKERAAARAAAKAAEAGDSAAGVVPGAVGKAEAAAADAQATVVVDRAAEEREKKRQLRKANREGIKAKNFVKSN